MYTGSVDYAPVSSIALTFQSTTDSPCSEIQIFEDGILEREEDFLVILSNSDRAVVTNSISTVNIINDDRKSTTISE